MLRDEFGRELRHLRITVTGECNYSCIFCHSEGENPSREELTAEEASVVARAAAELGVKFFKLTGGEPLMCKEIVEIVRSIKDSTGGEVSITTNGYFLEGEADALVSAGLDRANVSLHSLNRETYRLITGVDGLEKVKRGIGILRQYGLPLKLNFVLLRQNLHELWSLLEYASSIGANVNLIELLPLGLGERNFGDLFVDVMGVIPLLETRSTRVERRALQSRPAYFLDSGIRVEIIGSFCNPKFCEKCTKLRLTHDLKLKPCLMRSDNLLDLHTVLHSDLTPEEKVEAVKELIRRANDMREPYFRYSGDACVSADGRYIGKGRSL